MVSVPRDNPAARQHAVDDEVLVRRAREDPDQFVHLYERYADRLYRYAVSRTHSEVVAEDVVGDTMVAAIEGLPRFDPNKGCFVSWLFTIASRRIADRERRYRRFWRSVINRFAAHPVDEHVLETTVRREDQATVRRAMNRLSTTHRNVLVLRYVADLSFRDIGDVLGVSEGAAKMRLNRALNRLAEQLGASSAE
jgi:RNA polymerase sigma factor (sigma-70 family)